MEDLSKLTPPPTNLEEAVSLIVARMDEEDLAFAATHAPYEVHHGFGTYIRNTWQLWHEESTLAQWFRNNLGLGHADDMSGIILECVWREIKKQPWDVPGQVQVYKDYWQSQGINPLTQERITGF